MNLARRITAAARMVTHAARKGIEFIFDQPRRWAMTTPGSRFDYERRVGDGLGSAVIMAPVNWIARRMSESPILIAKDEDPPTADHDLVRLLRNPNPFYSGRTMRWALSVSLNLDGNAYLIKLRNRLKQPVQLWYCPHFLIEPHWPMGGTAYLDYYRYRAAGQEIHLDPTDVIHIRLGLDPRNVRKGFAPLSALLREVFTDDEAANFTASILRNAGVPGALISPDMDGGEIEDEDAKILKADFKASVTGDNRGEPIVTSGRVKVTPFGFSPKELDISSLRDVPEERVTAMLGVPAAVVGFGTGLQNTKVGAPQPLSARLWIPRGPSTMGEVAPGDVIAIPGGWGRVQHVYPQGEQDIYRVTFQDGSTAESTLDHLWDVHSPNQGRRVVPLAEIASWPAWRLKRAAVPLQGVTEFDEQPVLIPPYVLGLLLADGSFRGNLFFSNTDPEIVEAIREQVGAAYAVNRKTPDGYDYRIAYRASHRGRGIGGGSGSVNPFVQELRRLGLWMLTSPEKFIPDLYKYNTARMRQQLLQGILDGDGYVNLHGQPAIEQTSAKLADDITEIVQSLGGYTLRSLKRADQSIRLIKGRPFASRHDRIHLTIVIDVASSLFSCAYKRDRCRPRMKAATRKMRRIEFVRREQAQCIELEGGLYLTDNFIVTHNTMKEMRAMAYEDCIIPLQDLEAEELASQLLPDFEGEPEDWRLVHDRSAVRVLQEDAGARVDRAVRGYQGGLLLRSEGRELIGQKAEPEDEVYLQTFGQILVPKGTILAPDTSLASAGWPTLKALKAASREQRFHVQLQKNWLRMSELQASGLRKLFEAAGDQAAAAWRVIATDRGIETLGLRAALKDIDELEIYAGLVTEQVTLARWVDYGRHFLLVARQTFGTINTIFGLGVNLDAPAEARIVASGGIRKGLVDFDDQTRRSVFDALRQAREAGEGPMEAARRIRDRVPAGPWASAEVRSVVIGRTETKYAQNVSSLEAYAASEDITGILVIDAQLGETDEACFPAGTNIIAPYPQLALKRWFEGDLIAIETAAGSELSVTPKHPILTNRGWVLAGELEEGDQVVRHLSAERISMMARKFGPNNGDIPPGSEENADLSNVSLSRASVSEPFSAGHLDGQVVDSEIDVVTAHSALGDRDFSSRFQHEPQALFVGAAENALGFARRCASAQRDFTPARTPTSRVGGGDPGLPGGGGEAAIHDSSRVASRPALMTRDFEAIGDHALQNPEDFRDFVNGLAGIIKRDGAIQGERRTERTASDTGISEDAENCRPADSDGGRDLYRALSGQVSIDRVLAVSRRKFAAHVYNLRTRDGWYIANGIIAHNCEEINNQVVSLEEARRLAETEHPNGTRSFAPVVGDKATGGNGRKHGLQALHA